MSSTKQMILDVALNLFSQHGFSAVSIRDICSQVQIKESSVYYHFKNKQAIFDELLDRFEKKATDLMYILEQALTKQSYTLEEGFYQKVCDIFFENYLMDEFCNKVIRLLLIEQFTSNAVRQIYDHWMYEKPLEYQSKVFTLLINANIIPPSDSDYLAVKYYAPIHLFAHRWLFCGILSEDNKNSFRANAYKHIQNFFKEIEVS